MPNWCSGNLSIDANESTIKEILSYVCSEESEFDFENIVPIPENIYHKEKEQENHTESSRHDWSYNNWGTKWKASGIQVYENSITFETAWSPCSPVIAALAKQFPEAVFSYTYRETSMGFCGAEEYRDGKLVYIMEGDIEDCYYDEDDEPLHCDDLSPITSEDLYCCKEKFVPIGKKMNDSGNLLVCGRFYCHEYEDGRLSRRTNGYAAYKDNEPKYWH